MRLPDDPEIQKDLVLKNEVYMVVGACMEVHSTVGHGFHEKPYENALVVEFELRGIAIRQQPGFELHYKGHRIGEFIPDLVVFDQIIVDAKVIPKITDRERGQMLNYLKATGLRVGLIVNFNNPRLEWERLVR